MNLYLIIDVLAVGCGLYCLLQWMKMKKSGELVDSKFIYPNGSSRKNCRDPEGFYRYIMPRVLFFGGATTFAGLFSLANDLVGFLSGWIGTVVNLLFFGCVLYYGKILSISFKRFFS